MIMVMNPVKRFSGLYRDCFDYEGRKEIFLDFQSPCVPLQSNYFREHALIVLQFVCIMPEIRGIDTNFKQLCVA